MSTVTNTTKLPRTLAELSKLLKQGEGPTLEFKRSTGELQEGLRTIGAFLREILLNAVMHRDYADYSGHIAIAVFDDRVEIRSAGRLPAGVTVEQLSGPHLSKPRNPLIAETFHRTGAVEIWGRGTDRVVDECKRYGIEPPTFEERQGYVIVTFRAQIGPGAPSRDQVTLLQSCREERSLLELMQAIGRKNRTKFRDQFLKPLLDDELIEMTIPDKPNSRLQKYRLTESGEQLLRKGL